MRILHGLSTRWQPSGKTASAEAPCGDAVGEQLRLAGLLMAAHISVLLFFLLEPQPTQRADQLITAPLLQFQLEHGQVDRSTPSSDSVLVSRLRKDPPGRRPVRSAPTRDRAGQYASGA